MRFILLIFCSFVFFTLRAQHFLASYTGTYSGYLKICQAGKDCDSIPFELSIYPTKDPKRYNTKTSYLTDLYKDNVKDYDLIINEKHTDNCHYLLDEKDGILIQETKIGNTLYALYSVEGMLFNVTTRYFDQYIDYELVVYNMKEQQTSQSKPNAEEAVYTVETYPFMTVQKGILYKK